MPTGTMGRAGGGFGNLLGSLGGAGGAGGLSGAFSNLTGGGGGAPPPMGGALSGLFHRAAGGRAMGGGMSSPMVSRALNVANSTRRYQDGGVAGQRGQTGTQSGFAPDRPGGPRNIYEREVIHKLPMDEQADYYASQMARASRKIADEESTPFDTPQEFLRHLGQMRDPDKEGKTKRKRGGVAKKALRLAKSHRRVAA